MRLARGVSPFDVQRPSYDKTLQKRIWVLCVLLLFISIGIITVIMASGILSVYYIGFRVSSFLFYSGSERGLATTATLSKCKWLEITNNRVDLAEQVEH